VTADSSIAIAMNLNMTLCAMATLDHNVHNNHFAVCKCTAVVCACFSQYLAFVVHVVSAA